jgi:ankyrin repeat protein
VASERTEEEEEDEEEEGEEQEITDADRLVMAAARMEIDTLEELLDEGLDIDALDGDGDTALSYSVIKLCVGNPDATQTRDLLEQIDLLLSYGASVDVPGSRVAPLPMAARLGRLPLVRALLAGGADPNAVLTEIDEDAGRTALDVALAAGHAEIVSALVEAGGRSSEA